MRQTRDGGELEVGDGKAGSRGGDEEEPRSRDGEAQIYHIFYSSTHRRAEGGWEGGGRAAGGGSEGGAAEAKRRGGDDSRSEAALRGAGRRRKWIRVWGAGEAGRRLAYICRRGRPTVGVGGLGWPLAV
jgi:hypothetical protein